jgi:peroxiredoxin
MDDQPRNEPTEAPDPMPTVAVGESSIRAATAPAAGSRSRGRTALIVIGVALLAAVVALQVATLNQVGTTSDDLVALNASVTELDLDIAAVRDRTNALSEQLDGIQVAAASGASSAGVPAAQTVPAGSLPPFESVQNDPAVAAGMTLGEVTGTEYYNGTTLSYPSNSDKARVWMVWAHWCPYCQQELPELSAYWDANQDNFPNVELVSVTTSHDDSRGNPLEPYLDELALPFPVLVDEDLRLAGQFGTTSFPYWVVTDTEGTVLLRVSGAIPLEQVANIFTELEALTAAT